MGLLEWLGLRKEAPKKGETAPVQASSLPETAAPNIPKFNKPAEWKFPRQNMQFMPDSQKIDLILQGVSSIYDELRPMADDGSRISRLQLLLENLTPTERDTVRSKLEELDIDNAIVRFLEYPKSIEEIAGEIRKSYGYAAARLRHLRNTGKVARLRDPSTNKYKYTRIGETGGVVPIPEEPIEPSPAEARFDEPAAAEPEKPKAEEPVVEQSPKPEEKSSPESPL